MEERYKKSLENLIYKIKQYNNGFHVDLLKKAYNFSYNAHKDQLRKSGDPYFEHPLEVAKILVDLRLDIGTICGGLLHDVAEDTGVALDEVEEQFGAEIAALVDGVTKISELKFDSVEMLQAENFRKMIISMIKDIRVILIKFADRLHNMRTIEFLPERKRKRIARETLEVYAPLAHRLGIGKVKWELEDLSFKTLNNQAYEDLVNKVTEKREERERYIKRIVSPIRKELKKQNFEARISGRPKHFFSIYSKMQRRRLPFEEIQDLLAIRVIVKKVEECYFVLGIVHSLFTPIHERFDDYIATPKSNMYQSLHTTVIGPEGKIVEIQIRTEEMHQTAEEGIAAHWRYKDGKVKEDELDKHFVWLRKVLEWQQDAPDSTEFMENLKIDLFQDEVFIFTPKGDLYRLPAGSTPVDFAFAIHSDIGYHCLGAKVNSKIVPLNCKLRSGDTIEVITSSNQHPNQDWIKFVKTSKARSKIKRWIRESMFEQSLKLGEEIFLKEIKKYNIKRDEEELSEIAQSYGLSDLSQLYAAIGRGDIAIQGVIHKIAPERIEQLKDETFIKKFIRRAKSPEKGVRVQGIENMLINFGKCCQPVPGDRIIGFITKGRGVVIHRTDCKNIFNLMKDPERNIDVEWDVDKDKRFLVRLYMVAHDRRGFLRDVTEAISSTDANIVNVVLKTEDLFVHNNMLIEVRNLKHLTNIISKISKVKGIINVERRSGTETGFMRLDEMNILHEADN
jgi:guanosine-3',5'-bis(diphosphate) 3'-pyrophosphohydrolase